MAHIEFACFTTYEESDLYAIPNGSSNCPLWHELFCPTDKRWCSCIKGRKGMISLSAAKAEVRV